MEKICAATGFNILKSYDVKGRDRVFENGENLCNFCWATTHGVFDPKLVTEDRLASFCARYSSGEAGEIKLCPAENDFYHRQPRRVVCGVHLKIEKGENICNSTK